MVNNVSFKYKVMGQKLEGLGVYWNRQDSIDHLLGVD